MTVAELRNWVRQQRTDTEDKDSSAVKWLFSDGSSQYLISDECLSSLQRRLKRKTNKKHLQEAKDLAK
jgi:hypothetical protein